MRICIDFRPALHESTGVGTYVRGLLYGLLDTFPDEQYSAFSASWRHRLTASEFIAGARLIDVRFPVRVLDLLWNRVGWPPLERWCGRLDIAHSPSPLPLPSHAARRVVTVHDCYFLRHPEQVTGPMRRDFAPLLRRSLAAADAIVTNTETTRCELLELTDIPEDRVRVTPLGLDPAFIDPAPLPAPQTAGIANGYLLFVGRREPRKDPATLLRAFDRVLGRDPQQRLLLVGPDGLGWDAVWARATPRVRRRTLCLPHQPARRLASLYAGAGALLLPSRWEGFGLTAIEAMAMGTPVIASRAGALPEVLGNAARWVEVGDADGLAAACLAVAEDEAHRALLRSRGRRRAARYRWQETARRTHALYRELLA